MAEYESADAGWWVDVVLRSFWKFTFGDFTFLNKVGSKVLS